MRELVEDRLFRIGSKLLFRVTLLGDIGKGNNLVSLQPSTENLAAETWRRILPFSSGALQLFSVVKRQLELTPKRPLLKAPYKPQIDCPQGNRVSSAQTMLR